MRHRVPFAEIDLPDAWVDKTVYRFVSPTDDALDAPLASSRAAGVVATRASVALAPLVLAPDETVVSIVDTQRRGFRSALAGFRSEKEGAWTHPTGITVALEFSYDVAPNCRVHQALVYLAPDNQRCSVCITFTASAASFERRRPDFERVLASLCINSVG